MQTAGDARAGERLGGGVFAADGHQTGHFGLGDGDLLAAEAGQIDVGNLVIGELTHVNQTSIERE